jgi:uracil-DNA glycosylase
MQRSAKNPTPIAPLKNTPTWQQHVQRWKDCKLCPLCTQRDNIVLARGTLPCDVCFIGEAPGDSENFIGQPFVGPAGAKLDQIIEKAWSKAGHEVDTGGQNPDGSWITDWAPAELSYACTNLVACFPKLAKEAGDNEPSQQEIDACEPRLEEFIAIARPRLVVAVGKLAENNLPMAVRAGDTVEGHATVKWWTSITHPAAILRMPMVQQSMAVQRCVVILSNALENLL